MNQSSQYAHTFRLYKRITEQYSDQAILNTVRQLVPDKVLKSIDDEQSLEPLLHWFKYDFMKWMPKELQCTGCNRQMRVQLADNNSATLRNTVMDYDNELIKNVYPMYVSNNIEREKILDPGMKSIYEIRQNNLSKYNVSAQDNIVEINNVLNGWERYCAFMRRFLNIEASMDDIFESLRIQDTRKSVSTGLHVFPHSGDYPVPLRLLEKALEDEVTLIFYLNMMDAAFNPHLYYSCTHCYTEAPTMQNMPTIDGIKSILRNDDEIKNFLNSFMNDAIYYHEKEIVNISNSSNSLDLQISEPN